MAKRVTRVTLNTLLLMMLPKVAAIEKSPTKKPRRIETAQFDAGTRVVVKKVKVKPSDEIVSSYSFESETALYMKKFCFMMLKC